MKLISNPTECGYRNPLFTRLGLPVGIGCKKVTRISCYTDKVFPINCPLQNGQVISKKSLKEIIKSKYRNRKNCIHYNNQSNVCKCRHLIRTYCIGVTCGHYKPNPKLK